MLGGWLATRSLRFEGPLSQESLFFPCQLITLMAASLWEGIYTPFTAVSQMLKSFCRLPTHIFDPQFPL